MLPKLFFNEISVPARAVLLTAKALDLKLDLVSIDLSTGEQFKPEFLKKNPQHTVPTLDDDGHVLWDSHAINMYLSDKYGKTDSLYPNDLAQRSTINQRLFFSAGILQPAFLGVIDPLLFHGSTSIAKKSADHLINAYFYVEKFLEGHDYIASNSLTLADFSYISLFSTASNLVPVTQSDHPKLSRWMDRLNQLPYYSEANQVGSDKFVSLIKSKIAS